jgi:hypothetical protein
MGKHFLKYCYWQESEPGAFVFNKHVLVLLTEGRLFCRCLLVPEIELRGSFEVFPDLMGWTYILWLQKQFKISLEPETWLMNLWFQLSICVFTFNVNVPKALIELECYSAGIFSRILGTWPIPVELGISAVLC